MEEDDELVDEDKDSVTIVPWIVTREVVTLDEGWFVTVLLRYAPRTREITIIGIRPRATDLLGKVSCHYTHDTIVGYI